MRSGLVVVLRVALIIFLIEGAFMFVLPYLGLPSSAWMHALVDATALTPIGGVCIYFLVIKPYIGARDTSEQQLRESEERFRDFARSSSDWFWEAEERHRFKSVAGQSERFAVGPG